MTDEFMLAIEKVRRWNSFSKRLIFDNNFFWNNFTETAASRTPVVYGNMDQSHFSRKNLAVMSYRSLNSIQRERINSEVRLFLAEQYEQVLSSLKTHESFVESIADRLMWDPVVDQFEMIDVCREFRVHTEPAHLTNSENQRRFNMLS